ncbi:hypothetical protein BT63DRAFT_425161 [Microthyrium microscopicum]|uniref:Uncharacterized protein n=1 Tax=Microthyrium microscopicum TaxID=703497 RepID=A0A6A6UDB7_9PEZI|nr:hypothetical protein BT63DRAFT_425161 [Microthyrium microscopicum]
MAMLSSLPRWYKSWNYSQVEDDPLMEKNQDDENQVIRPQRKGWWKSTTFLWISNIIFFSLTVWLYFTPTVSKTISAASSSASSSLGSFEEGFSTEIAGARSQISIETKMFWGTPTWTKEGVGSLILDPNERRFIGEANDELDDNWMDTIGGKSCKILQDDRAMHQKPSYLALGYIALEAFAPSLGFIINTRLTITLRPLL